MTADANRTTRFAYTKVPDTAHYKGADWSGHQVDHRKTTVDQAKTIAEGNPEISYFFHTRDHMTLEGAGGQDRKFTPDDSTFFSGDSVHLGEAKGYADTYLLAEQYDLSHAATRDSILTELRDEFLLDDGVDARSGTTEQPQTVTAGFVFVDFSDVNGGDIAQLRTKLEGPTDDEGRTALISFVERESGGRVKLALEVYEKDDKAAWVTVPGTHDDYEDDFPKVATAVDELIEFPNDWDIVLFAFPDKPSGATTTTTTADDADPYEEGAYWLASSRCINGQTVDTTSTAQEINFTFMDPGHYDDTHGAHYVTIHEVMHAFRLPDLYYSDSNRSYGWSIMSAMAVGEQITNFEKLLLGWLDPSSFVFLKRGLMPADDLVAAEGIKGVVVLPDGDRKDVYAIEKAQDIGYGPTNRAAYAKKHADDPGLLLLMLRSDGKQGRIVPFVARRPSDPLAERKLYGGASQAPFRKSDSFDTNGIFSHPTQAHGLEGKTPMTRVIGVRPGATVPTAATQLRENEQIRKGDHHLRLTPSGRLQIDGAPGIKRDGDVVSYRVTNQDYGFVAAVDDAGALRVAAALDATAAATSPLAAVEPPADTASTDDGYELQIVTGDDETWVKAFKVSEDADAGDTGFKVIRPPHIVRGWTKEAGRYILTLGDDGNLMVHEDGTFQFGTIQAFGRSEGKVYGIDFTDDGAMRCIDADGTVTRTFQGTTGTGPFELTVEGDEDAGTWDLVVKDEAGTILYRVFGHRFDRPWNMDHHDTYSVGFDDMHNLKMYKDGAYLGGTYHVYGRDVGKPDHITLGKDGDMRWWKDGATEPYYRISGRDGKAPFTLAHRDHGDGRADLVVKDRDNTVLYPVFGHRFERGWKAVGEIYTVHFDDTGSLNVEYKDADGHTKKDFIVKVRSLQVFGAEEGQPATIDFAADGTMQWKDDKGTVLRSFSGSTTPGGFALSVEDHDNMFDLVWRGRDEKTSPVFRCLQRGWSSDGGGLKVVFGPDGNLMVRQGASFVEGSRQVYGDPDGFPSLVAFRDTGEMVWVDVDEDDPLETFEVDTPGAWPATLAVEKSNDGVVRLVGRDAENARLYDVYGHVSRGFEVIEQERSLKLTFQVDDGNLMVHEGETFVAGSRQEFGMAEGDPHRIAFDTDGTMAWLRENESGPYKTFPASARGRGPFTIGFAGLATEEPQVAVLDAEGEVVTPIYDLTLKMD